MERPSTVEPQFLEGGTVGKSPQAHVSPSLRLPQMVSAHAEELTQAVRLCALYATGLVDHQPYEDGLHLLPTTVDAAPKGPARIVASSPLSYTSPSSRQGRPGLSLTFPTPLCLSSHCGAGALS